jgi:hypothetical protein
LIHGDACQPSRKLRLFLKVAEVEENLVKTVLHNIFCVLAVIRYPQRHGKNSPFVTKNQFLEGMRIPALCGSHKRAVGVLAYITSTKDLHNSLPPRPLLKRRTTLNKAIGAPEAAGDDNGLEVADRMGDGSIQWILGSAGRHANLSGC